MGSSIAFAAAYAALAIQAAAPVSAVPPLKPSSPWNLEYADSMCVLQRQFGAGNQQVTLGFKPGLFSDNMRLVLVRKSDESRTIRGEALLHFDGTGQVKGRFIEGKMKDGDVRAAIIDLDAPELAPLLSAKQMNIRIGKYEVAFAPNAVPPAMKALDACQKDLLTSWGMDAATVAAIATWPKVRGGLVSIFNTSDYPTESMRRNEEGTAGVKFWVSKDGRVGNCTVVETSGSPRLDEKTCSVISRRADFEPAKTVSGDAVDAIAFQRVRWELP